ncbi:MAG: hypothetical protein ACPL3P_05770 [Anaerolineales bacterium]
MPKKEKEPPNDETKKPPESKPSKGLTHPSLPYILDFSFSISNLIILLAGVITTSISLFHGAEVIWAVIRGGLAMLGLGAVIWLLNYYLANQVLEVAAKDFKKAGESTAAPDNTTMEFKA